jgi:hypothetical protein
MEIRVVREQYKPASTIGRMYVDDVFECFTLEDGIRTHKVYGETAIPAGAYAVTVNRSPRFKTDLPLLLDVPSFEGVRIHPGNSNADTLGCILVGKDWTPGAEKVGASRKAFGALMPKIVAALERGEKVLLRVIQENAPAVLATRALAPRAPKAPGKKRKTKRGAKSAGRTPKKAVRKPPSESAKQAKATRKATQPADRSKKTRRASPPAKPSRAGKKRGPARAVVRAKKATAKRGVHAMRRRSAGR